MDNRLAELLAKYDIQGTFYIPATNIEGRSTLTEKDIISLSSSFEIGGHTYSHIYLDKLSSDRAWHEIVDGKEYIEQILGTKISGFCYPGGKYNCSLKQLVKNAGFEYARTIANLSITPGYDPFQLSTTLQLYDHSKTVYCRNYLNNLYREKASFALLLICLKTNTLSQRLHNCLDFALKSGGIFHLWGHSWEIEEYQGWKILENFFMEINGVLDKDSRITNSQTAQLLANNTIL